MADNESGSMMAMLVAVVAVIAVAAIAFWMFNGRAAGPDAGGADINVELPTGGANQ